MAISRPYLFVLVGVVLLAVTWFAMQRVRGASTEETPSAPAADSSPPPAERQRATPRAGERSASAGGQSSRPADRERSGSARQSASALSPNARQLNRAVRDGRPAVLFFHQRRGLDDQATAEAVQALETRPGVLVLRDDVRNSHRYGKLVERLGVSQAPAIVIVDRDGKARLLEGFVDAGSLVQEVADLR